MENATFSREIIYCVSEWEGRDAPAVVLHSDGSEHSPPVKCNSSRDVVVETGLCGHEWLTSCYLARLRPVLSISFSCT